MISQRQTPGQCATSIRVKDMCNIWHYKETPSFSDHNAACDVHYFTYSLCYLDVWLFAVSRLVYKLTFKLPMPPETFRAHIFCIKCFYTAVCGKNATMCPTCRVYHMYRKRTYSADDVGRLKPTKMCNFVFPIEGKNIFTDIVNFIH